MGSTRFGCRNVGSIPGFSQATIAPPSGPTPHASSARRTPRPEERRPVLRTAKSDQPHRNVKRVSLAEASATVTTAVLRTPVKSEDNRHRRETASGRWKRG